MDGAFLKKDCFNYDHCHYQILPCNQTHQEYRYNDASAVWVLIASIIVFFMKAGFLLVELSFAKGIREKRHVVVVKHLDVFASAFGFFLFGFDFISRYSSPQGIDYTFFEITDPVLWFFKFTFASNAATIIGGCLVTNTYKLRLPAAFVSAFIISGVIHPIIARIIWTDLDTSLSPYRFCEKTYPHSLNCTSLRDLNFGNRMYILDFAGGGAVHLLGGVAGLVLCLFAKLHNFLENRKHGNQNQEREPSEDAQKRNFWEWMYPVDGGGENTSEAALGVLILWFCWFAFNCGSTESIQSKPYKPVPYHAVSAVIAVNMTLAAASGGIVAVIIASWAQMRSRSESVNANEIANGVLSALVAITAGCPFVDYWAACIIGAVAVVVYHLACWLEYKLKIEDTAHVVPVHGACGLWSMLAVGLLVVDRNAECNVHSTFEGLCYCTIRLPPLSYGERLASQIIGSLIMIGVTVVISVIMYGLLFVIPIRTRLSSNGRFAKYYDHFMSRFFKFLCNQEDIVFEGNLLFTGPGEIPAADHRLLNEILTETINTIPTHSLLLPAPQPIKYGSVNQETLGSKDGRVPDSESHQVVNTVSSRGSNHEIPLSGSRQRGSRSAQYVSLREEEEETI